MKKIYKSYGNRKIMVIVKQGCDMETITFKRDIIEPSRNVWGCSFETDDEAVQYGIEHHKYYNAAGFERVWTDDAVEKVKKPKKEKRAKAKE